MVGLWTRGFSEDLSGPIRTSEGSSIYPLWLNLEMDDASVLDEGKWELRFGTSFNSGDYKGINDNWDSDISADNLRSTVSLDYGIGHGLQIGATLPYMTWDGNLSLLHNNQDWFKQKNISGGIGDASLRLKYHLPGLLEELDDAGDIATGFVVKFPSGDSGEYLGDKKYEYGIYTAYSREFPMTTLHLNLGYTFLGKTRIFEEDVHLDNAVSYGAALNFPLNKNMAIVTQVTGSTNPLPTTIDSLDKSPVEATIGVKIKPKNDLSVSLAGSAGLTESAADYAVHLTVSQEFGGVTEVPEPKKEVKVEKKPEVEKKEIVTVPPAKVVSHKPVLEEKPNRISEPRPKPLPKVKRHVERAVPRGQIWKNFLFVNGTDIVVILIDEHQKTEPGVVLAGYKEGELVGKVQIYQVMNAHIRGKIIWEIEPGTLRKASFFTESK